MWCSKCYTNSAIGISQCEAIKNWNARAPQSEWISVDEAPLNKEVLFFVSGGVGHVIGFKSAGSHDFISDNNKYHSINVLGWMPLPNPPEAK